jgi:membrane protease YdiL (CAAX protease family)
MVLQRRFSPVVASLILAPFWALWHAPYFRVLENYRGFGPGQIVGFRDRFDLRRDCVDVAL